jgi:hypothetical protein
MSKRAEKAALKAYPVKMTPLVYQDLIDQFGGKTEIDVNTYPRCLFQEGYEYAEKDTIERAVAWLKENANKYIVDIGVGYGEYGRNVEIIVGGMCWEDLKKAMEI